ncbi:Protein NLP9 [Striga hermonthica]|uniref:Protein NLP9 n=1 Tax=Striga hermonthica TaxID=68872 RepID=A0A9N7R9R9_STRHE|nr:Protein NLP9 [Striga hermonthica]
MDYSSSKGKEIDHSELPSSLVEGASTSFSPFNELNFMHPETSISDDNITGSAFIGEDEVMFQEQLGSEVPFSTSLSSDGFDLTEMGDESLGQQDAAESIYAVIPRTPTIWSLSERMLTALNLFKQLSGEGVLAQVWVPICVGDCYVLSTCEQPYLPDQMLFGYREASRLFTFALEPRPGNFLGLPGRVFSSKVPEWTTNVMYYNKCEFIRVQHALAHEVRGSIALPVFDEDDGSPKRSCCAVLELATMKDKSDFDLEIENVCRALEAVNLWSILPPRLRPQSFSANQRAVLAEIYDVLRSVCHAHNLPLALTWIPCSYREDHGVETIKVLARGRFNSSKEKCVLCVEDSACYVNDKDVKGFVHACVGHCLEEGQGVAGKAFQSNQPFFNPDVKQYDINDYPLVHHARKFGLNAAVAIRLRSRYTADNDYVIEFFLPVNVRGSAERVLLNNLSSTMHRVCKSLRKVTDDELQHGNVNLQDVEMRRTLPEQLYFTGNLDYVFQANQNLSESSISCVTANASHQQAMSESSKLSGRKRNTTEKHVSYSDLKQHFSGSLNDAAKSIGVCPTTLKRICRSYGIMRWPCRKIKKVKSSLKHVQGLIDSVQVMEGLELLNPMTDMSQQQLDFGNGVIVSNGNPEPAIQNINFDPKTTIAISNSQATGGTSTDSSELGSIMNMNMNDSSSGSLSVGKMQKSKLVVKATYKEDIVRFKFEARGRCAEVYEEVAKRFRLNMGEFQLKYLDDEGEWVLLVTDSDLNECLETLDCMGSCYLKLLVRDCDASTCFLEPG